MLRGSPMETPLMVTGNECDCWVRGPRDAATLAWACWWLHFLRYYFTWDIWDIHAYIYICICICICIYIYMLAPPLRSTFDALLETYMVKLSAHFNKGCSKFIRYGQTQCTLQLSVQWVHQTWSNSMHTSVKCAVSLITWNFVSRCGSTFDALQETYMVKLTAHFS